MTKLRVLIDQAKRVYNDKHSYDRRAQLENMVFKLTYELEKLCDEIEELTTQGLETVEQVEKHFS